MLPKTFLKVLQNGSKQKSLAFFVQELCSVEWDMSYSQPLNSFYGGFLCSSSTFYRNLDKSFIQTILLNSVYKKNFQCSSKWVVAEDSNWIHLETQKVNKTYQKDSEQNGDFFLQRKNVVAMFVIMSFLNQ